MPEYFSGNFMRCPQRQLKSIVINGSFKHHPVIHQELDVLDQENNGADQKSDRDGKADDRPHAWQKIQHDHAKWRDDAPNKQDDSQPNHVVRVGVQVSFMEVNRQSFQKHHEQQPRAQPEYRVEERNYGVDYSGETNDQINAVQS